MRALLLLFAALALIGAAAPRANAPASRPWTEVATPAPAGSYNIGNPQARVRLVEVVSYTCPHCADFIREAAPSIDAWVARGQLSLEIRNQIHDPVDVAAATIARCVGAARFPAFHRTLYARQQDWVGKGFDYVQSNGARLQLYSEQAQIRAIADNAGLSDLGRAAGMSDAALDRCFAGTATRDALRVSQGVSNFSGTPGFLLGGKQIERVTWATMKPRLAAVGLK